MPLPNCPEDLTISMRVYTRSNPNTGQVITRTTIPPAYDGSKRTNFIVHGWLGGRDNNWLHLMKDDMLVDDDVNVVVVGWDEGSQNLWYPQSASDTRAVGSEIGLVARNVIANGGSATERLYCIGHSLGGHICGHAGMTEHFGRITGLDPAGPWFEGREDPTVGLNPTCADSVDVIHTNGLPGIILNLGTMNVLGHVDFYPHGGGRQPGCILDPREEEMTLEELGKPGIQLDWMPACSHNRVLTLFRESILTPCFNVRYADCSDQYDVPASCTLYSDPVQNMGYHADNYGHTGIFFLETGRESPFCQG
jgi:hypothetical protein